MISILMSAYKEKLEILQNAISSILEQECSEDIELVLIIDDPTNAEILSWAESHLAQKDNVLIIKNETNEGLANSLNKAIRYAKGEYLCRMDSDDIAYPNRLNTQLTYLKKYDLDLIGGRMEVIDESGSPLYITPKLPSSPDALRKASCWNNCIPHPTWFGKRSVFQQLYRNIPLCEDYDFQLRALKNGKRLGNCNDVVLKYRFTQNSISRNNLYSQYLYQRYITSCFKRHEIANIEETKSYVANHFNKQAEERYFRANNYFNKGISEIHKGHAVVGCKDVLRSIFTSLSYSKKIMRFALAKYFALFGK